jgi:hypothetical protein
MADNIDNHASDASDASDASRELAQARQSVVAAEAAARRARDQFKYHAISLLILERQILDDEQRGNLAHAAALRGLIARYNANVEAATDAAISAAASLQQARDTLTCIEQAQGHHDTSS